MKKKISKTNKAEIREPKKEAQFEHKIIKDARKMAKDLKKGKANYGK